MAQYTEPEQCLEHALAERTDQSITSPILLTTYKLPAVTSLHASAKLRFAVVALAAVSGRKRSESTALPPASTKNRREPAFAPLRHVSTYPNQCSLARRIKKPKWGASDNNEPGHSIAKDKPTRSALDRRLRRLLQLLLLAVARFVSCGVSCVPYLPRLPRSRVATWRSRIRSWARDGCGAQVRVLGVAWQPNRPTEISP